MFFPTETVTVSRRINTGVNPIGETMWEHANTVVDGVLVAPGDGKTITDSNRPDGVLVTFTVFFPKTFQGDLRGATVSIRGIDCRVIGDPQRWLNPPGKWDLVADVEAVHG